MKIAIIGVGAIGGYYGGLLCKAGFDVHFLLHRDYEHVKKNGLIVDSSNGNFILPKVNSYNDADKMPQCDVIIVALKTTQNEILGEILPKIVKKDSIIIMMQNGLGVEKDIAGKIPDAIIMGGLCFICSNKIGPGHIKHIDYGSVKIGEYKKGYTPCGITNSMEIISKIFVKANINVQLVENIGGTRWKKLVWNIPFNGLSVILNATTKNLIDNQSSRKLVEDLMMEVIGGADKCGYSIEESYKNVMINVTEKMEPYKTSMMLDFELKRMMEVEKIYWQPVKDARESGYDMKITRTLALQLDYINKTLP